MKKVIVFLFLVSLLLVVACSKEAAPAAEDAADLSQATEEPEAMSEPVQSSAGSGKAFARSMDCAEILPESKLNLIFPLLTQVTVQERTSKSGKTKFCNALVQDPSNPGGEFISIVIELQAATSKLTRCQTMLDTYEKVGSEIISERTAEKYCIYHTKSGVAPAVSYLSQVELIEGGEKLAASLTYMNFEESQIVLSSDQVFAIWGI